MHKPQRWRVRTDADLRWHSWGAYSALFHPSSGDTFLVDEVAAEGLRCLEVSALDGAGLCAVLGLRLNIEDDADLARYVDEMVTRYANLGLLEAEAP